MSWITNITTITWVVNPSANQIVDLGYRQGGTSGAYTSVGSVTFAPDGTIVGTTPFQITGIDDTWTSIQVNAVNECSGTSFLATFNKPT